MRRNDMARARCTKSRIIKIKPIRRIKLTTIVFIPAILDLID